LIISTVLTLQNFYFSSLYLKKIKIWSGLEVMCISELEIVRMNASSENVSVNLKAVFQCIR